MNREKQYRRYAFVLVVFFVMSPTAQPIVHADQHASVLINEVMYHPQENEATNEWIELYNPSSEPIDISGWTIADEKETDNLQADPINGNGITAINPGGYAIITDLGATVYQTFQVDDHAVRLTVDDSTLCGYGLNNQQEKLILADAAGTTIDALEWGASYDDIPGAPAPLVAKGHTLARIQNTADSSVDFVEATTPTPGYANSVDEQNDAPIKNNNGTGIQIPPIRITAVYYYTHPGLHDEFVQITNPTNSTIDLSGWYLTDEPWKEPEDQAKILFPDATNFPANSSWFITKNASDFLWETGTPPDFVYGDDTQNIIPKLTSYKTVLLSNTGGYVGLYTSSADPVDLVSYGEATQMVSGWSGPSVPDSGQGVILRRNTLNGTPVDTDTAADWIHPRVYKIGQTELTPHTITFTGKVTVFVSPDNSFEAIVGELHKATRSIDCNIYEFTNPFLCDELIAALDRHVSVTLFLEGAPPGGIDPKEYFLLHQIQNHGGAVRFMVSDEKNKVYARYGFDHAKYLVIDNTTVIVESCNWANTGVPKDPTYGNREWGLVIRNTEVSALFLKVFLADSSPLRCDSYPLEKMNETTPPGFFLSRTVPHGGYTPRFTAQTFNGTQIITPVFSPDTSEELLCDAVDAANTTIYVEQLYIYKDWGEQLSPLVEHLVNKSTQGVDIRVVLDYNPEYTDTVQQLNDTRQYLEENGVQVKCISTAWSPFTTVHNKGMVIDNRTVLVSSINWNQQSVTLNREAGVLLTNPAAATYYAGVFLSDWYLEPHQKNAATSPGADYKNLLLIAVVCGITGALIVRDWRKRKWR
ncbi:MAG TPA: phospholipase D-like domain-containing protein [Candidatus Thermoplasmatota archaeon]|nr:phospholipase D-like domain-containing protein [Candidatus Thermoplasmatota archaeon]